MLGRHGLVMIMKVPTPNDHQEDHTRRVSIAD
jgi:hypothetical protein